MSEILRLRARRQKLELERVEAVTAYNTYAAEVREILGVYNKPEDVDREKLRALFSLILKELEHIEGIDRELKVILEELGED